MSPSPAGRGFSFHVQAQDPATPARTGLLTTSRGSMDTPVFMAVGTQATVKTLDPRDLTELAAPILLANTYHLYLRPGTEIIGRFGGIHRFMGWDGPLLTDSGGYQVFSLGHRRTIDEEGVTFRSHIDGSAHRFTPEMVMGVQRDLGADIVMAFDECVPPGADAAYARASTERTHRWAARCQAVALREEQSLFGIVQGGMTEEGRRWSARAIVDLGFPGYAVGGLSVGEEKAVTWEMAAIACEELPRDQPRYLMGVGSPEDLVHAIGAGVDMFDCVLPTRVARNGALLTRAGRLNVLNSRFRTLEDSPVPGCGCPCCSRFSGAYLHHLFKAREVLGLRLATQHNLWFLYRLLDEARDAIRAGTYGTWAQAFLEGYRQTNQVVRTEQKLRWLQSRAG